MVVRVEKVPPQGFFSVPAGSVLTVFCNVKVYFEKAGPKNTDLALGRSLCGSTKF